jgi:hypothetical protein
MRKLDIMADDLRNGRYHWYAIDIGTRQRTNEGCCSISGKGAECAGFKTEQRAKQAGYAWNRTRNH